MISFWRNRRRSKLQPPPTLPELIIPAHFLCPISHDLMTDPVILPTGITYDRPSIDTWLESGHSTCPVTNQHLLPNPYLLPNHAVRKMIQNWCVQNRSYGIDRIPTPKIPITADQVLEILSDVQSSVLRNDAVKCVDSVRRIKASARESDRNRRCIFRLGAGLVLAKAFESFARMEGHDFDDHNGDLFEEILSGFPQLDVEATRILSTTPVLNKITSIMKFGSLSARRHAVVTLNSILSSHQSHVLDEFVNIQDSLETLVKLIKEPICPTTTKASLLVLYHMLTPPEEKSSNLTEKIAARLVEMESIPMLIELLVDSDRSLCEKALGVLDGLCNHADATHVACGNALTVPVLVKKLLRVSDLTTELSISVLAKLGKHDYDGTGNVIEEAMQAGGFQKLLLVLQIGTGEGTKEKVTELLKMMNLYKGGVHQCNDSLDMMHVKRPF